MPNNQLDLLLVNPGNLKSQFGGVSEYATIAQPLGITMLAAYVREHNFSVDILDAEVLGLGVEDAVQRIIEEKVCYRCT